MSRPGRSPLDSRGAASISFEISFEMSPSTAPLECTHTRGTRADRGTACWGGTALPGGSLFRKTGARFPRSGNYRNPIAKADTTLTRPLPRSTLLAPPSCPGHGGGRWGWGRPAGSRQRLALVQWCLQGRRGGGSPSLSRALFQEQYRERLICVYCVCAPCRGGDEGMDSGQDLYVVYGHPSWLQQGARTHTVERTRNGMHSSRRFPGIFIRVHQPSRVHVRC